MPTWLLSFFVDSTRGNSSLFVIPATTYEVTLVVDLVSFEVTIVVDLVSFQVTLLVDLVSPFP